MARFDWYQATVTDTDLAEILAELLRAYDLSSVRDSNPKNGYQHGSEIYRGDQVLAEVWYGGNGGGIHVKASGEHSVIAASCLQGSFWGRLRVTRADSCVDLEEPELFNKLAEKFLKFATANDISINQQGDWERGEARTLYLGSKTSAVRLVMYEKGYEVGGSASRDWVRLEVRVRPQKEAKSKVSDWCPDRCFSASPWLVNMLTSVGWKDLKAEAIGTVYKRSDDEKVRYALLKQYRKCIENWADEEGGFENLGQAIKRQIDAIESDRVRQATRPASRILDEVKI